MTARRDLLDWVVDRRVDAGVGIGFLVVLSAAAFGLPALGAPDWTIAAVLLPMLLVGLAFAALVFAAGRRRRRLWDSRMQALGFRRAPGQGPAHFRTYMLERQGRTLLAALEAAPEPRVFLGRFDEWGEERQVSVPFGDDETLRQAVDAFLDKGPTPAALPSTATPVVPPPGWMVWGERARMGLGLLGAVCLFVGLEDGQLPLAWSGALLLAGCLGLAFWLRALLRRMPEAPIH